MNGHGESITLSAFVETKVAAINQMKYHNTYCMHIIITTRRGREKTVLKTHTKM